MNKNECREQARRIMAQLPAAALAGRGQAFAQALEALPEYAGAHTVFCYLSVDKEPETRPLIARALAAGKTVCAPVCIARGVMRARRLRSLADLVPGRYDIPVPPEDEPWIEPGQIDFAVVPCVACGRDGTRLGHGAGFYDRFLAGGHFTRAAVCHSELLLDTVPVDAHDEPMDVIVTQGQTLCFAGRQGAR